jgi:hypothetical protein
MIVYAFLAQLNMDWGWPVDSMTDRQ